RLDEVTELDQLRLAAGRASLTNLSFGERRKLISWINATDTDVLPTYSLPVRPLKLGRRTYLEPKIRDVGSLIGDLWSVKSTARVSVIVLNGAGNPGVARALAGKLEDMNYNVIAVKNADSFDYAESRVLVYGQPGAAVEIVETMGVGAVAQARFRPKSIDLAVVVGKDYDPRP
ncbi:MAG: LytR C-terminal domain-containing protein, partial [Terriglobia bacterium]